jgi:hypothetical protein
MFAYYTKKEAGLLIKQGVFAIQTFSLFVNLLKRKPETPTFHHPNSIRSNNYHSFNFPQANSCSYILEAMS